MFTIKIEKMNNTKSKFLDIIALFFLPLAIIMLFTSKKGNVKYQISIILSILIALILLFMTHL